MEQDGPHWTDFHEILYLSVFRKSAEKTQAISQSDNNNGTSHADRYTFMIISRPVLLRIRNVSDKSARKIKTQILCSVPFFSKIVPFFR